MFENCFQSNPRERYKNKENDDNFELFHYLFKLAFVHTSLSLCWKNDEANNSIIGLACLNIVKYDGYFPQITKGYKK